MNQADSTFVRTKSIITEVKHNYNLMKYIVRIHGNDPLEYSAPVRELWEQTTKDWNKMVEDPMCCSRNAFLIKNFQSRPKGKIDVERQHPLCYKKSEIESLLSRFNDKYKRDFTFGEPGENPGRTRRCKWERKPYDVTVLYTKKPRQHGKTR